MHKQASAMYGAWTNHTITNKPSWQTDRQAGRQAGCRNREIHRQTGRQASRQTQVDTERYLSMFLTVFLLEGIVRMCVCVLGVRNATHVCVCVCVGSGERTLRLYQFINLSRCVALLYSMI